jgi:hypothetical protein
MTEGKFRGTALTSLQVLGGWMIVGPHLNVRRQLSICALVDRLNV